MESLTFDQWAQAIATHVLEAFPQTCVKRKVDDVYRWTFRGRECQVHAVSEKVATFIALYAGHPAENDRRPECISIDASTQREIASRIIRWFYSGASS
jgi:hypothetical protein